MYPEVSSTSNIPKMGGIREEGKEQKEELGGNRTPAGAHQLEK